MANYVDGFLLPVPKKNIGAYLRMSRSAGKVWRKYGAIEYRECFADDLNHKGIFPFPRAIRLKKGETVVFSWIVYKSKSDRNRVNAKVMKDKRILRMMKAKPIFDSKRMAYGGFKVRVDL